MGENKYGENQIRGKPKQVKTKIGEKQNRRKQKQEKKQNGGGGEIGETRIGEIKMW